MTSIHLFYSWQSDRDTNLCRNFIALALEAAATHIEAERGIAVHIDSDTTGVPGTPPVTDTILAKIEKCDIFVADMSFVGVTAGGKHLPNPNVLTEYGYARRARGNERILLVMNSAFGDPTELPFDLRHMRFPATFAAPMGISDGARRTVRAAFAASLVPKLGEIIDHVLAERTAARPAADLIQTAQERTYAIDLLTGRGDVPAIVSNPRLRMQLVPLDIDSFREFDLRDVKALWPRFVPAGFAPNLWNDRTEARGWAIYDPPRAIDGRPNPEGRWYTRLIRPGIFEQAVTIGYREGDDDTIVVEGRKLESRIVHGAIQLAGLAQALGFSGPALFAAQLHGTADLQIQGSRRTGRAFGLPDISLDSRVLPALASIDAAFLRPMLNRFWLDAGFEDGSPSFEQGDWAGLANDRLYGLG